MPVIDFDAVIASFLEPAFWLSLGAIVVVCAVGLMLRSKAFWRVTVALAVGIYGLLMFLDGMMLPAWPAYLWGPAAGICVLTAGWLLDRARRLHKTDLLAGTSKHASFGQLVRRLLADEEAEH